MVNSVWCLFEISQVGDETLLAVYATEELANRACERWCEETKTKNFFVCKFEVVEN